MSENKILDNFNKIISFRRDYFEQIAKGKASPKEFGDYCYQFILQQKIKPIAKAYSREAVLLNYYYWTIHIERKLSVERKLIELGVGSEEKFRELSQVFVQRRDQMVRRLIWEIEEEVIKSYIVFRDTVEIVLKSGEILYSSKESLAKVKMDVSTMGKSLNIDYLPILDISFEY